MSSVISEQLNFLFIFFFLQITDLRFSAFYTNTWTPDVDSSGKYIHSRNKQQNTQVPILTYSIWTYLDLDSEGKIELLTS